jgi:hypothetical protein
MCLQIDIDYTLSLTPLLPLISYTIWPTIQYKVKQFPTPAKPAKPTNDQSLQIIKACKAYKACE